MSNRKKQKNNLLFVKIFGFLLGLCLVVWMNIGSVYAEEAGNTGTTGDGKLKNGSFEEGQTWTNFYLTQDQSAIPNWNTTASDKKIELFGSNDGKYITGVKLAPKDGSYAAELNANEESTLYQNVKTTPSSIYKWGLDHGARNGTDTMALVIGPKQEVDPSKPSKTGRDQFMQMVDWLIAQGKTSVKTSAGRGEQLVVYSKKFAANGTFQDNTGNNAFSLTPSSIYTEEWHIWIMASSRATSGTNPWESYGSNAEVSNSNTGGTSNTELDLSKYYLYTVPAGQTETLFGFVSVGYVNSPVGADKAKTYGNFLDNINFEIYHPLSGSSTLHGSGVVGGSDGTATGGGGLSTGYEVTVDKKLITYAADNGKPLKIQAVVKKSDVDAGCEFVGMYYTKQTQNGAGELELTTSFLQLAGNEIADTGNLTDEEKRNKWIKSTNSNGDIIYTYYLENITSATDLHFVFIKSPTITYDPNGGKPYVVERTYNTDEAANVYSYKPARKQPAEEGKLYTYIPPYVSQAAEGQNDGWKFMGWLLTGDTVASTEIPHGTELIHADDLGTMLLPAEHTIACDYAGETTKKEQYFKIWDNKNISLTEETDYNTYVKWQTDTTPVYANVHKGLTLVAQWRWRQAFVPQKKTGTGYVDSNEGGTVEITSVTDKSATNDNYNGAFNEAGGKSYYAETDEVVTAVATAKDGYEFAGWYDEAGHLLTTQVTYSYTETKEKVGTYYARFSPKVTQTYVRQVMDGDVWKDIEGTADNEVGNLDRYTYTDVVGTSISATATAKTGYECIGWYDAYGNPVDSEMLSVDKTTISYETTGDATYYARFKRVGSAEVVTQTYIRQVKNGADWENTTDDSVGILTRYTHCGVVGETASSNATVGDGYEFVGWYDASENPVAAGMLSDGGKTISYTTTGDATYYARFEKKVAQTYIRQVKDGDTWKDIEGTADNAAGNLTRYTHCDIAGKTVSSTAEAKSGYRFEGWYDEAGNEVAADKLSSDGKTLSYTTTGDATYYARFEKKVTQTYIRQVKDGDTWKDIEGTADNAAGNLTRYTHCDIAGKTVSSTAEAKSGYRFEGWFDEAGNEVAADKLSSDGKIISYTTTGDATYYARFTKTVTQKFVRQVKNGETWETTEDDSIGTLTLYTDTDEAGKTVSSTAEAKSGYRFEGWYDEAGNEVAADKLSSDGKTLSYTTTGDATYYARFTKTVTQKFVRRVKDGSDWEDTTDDSIGTLTLYTDTDEAGKTVSSTAEAKSGYRFEGWYDEAGNEVTADKLSSDGKTISYETSGNATYYARFQREEAPEPPETVTQTYIRQVKNGETWEDITDITDNTIGTLTSYSHIDVVGATASSTATAGDGYEFVGWYDADGHEVANSMLTDEGNTLSYVTTGNATYYARFEREEAPEPPETVTQIYIRQVKNGETWENITDTTDNTVGTLTSYTHTDVVGATASSTATAGDGYEFVGWYDADGHEVADTMLTDEGNTLSYATTGNATYYARFKIQEAPEPPETVTQTYIRQVKNGETWGDITNITDNTVGTLIPYYHMDVVGATASSTATAGDGYEFVGWYDVYGTKVEEGNILSYTTTGNATYYARFQREEAPEPPETVSQTYACQIKSGETWGNTADANIGTVTCEILTDEVGTTVSATAEAGEGYEFLGWFDADGNPVGTAMLSADKKTIRYTITESVKYYARFSKSAVTEDPETTETTATTETTETTEVTEQPTTLEETNKQESAKTGDDSNPVLWTFLLLASMTALAGLFVRRKRK